MATEACCCGWSTLECPRARVLMDCNVDVVFCRCLLERGRTGDGRLMVVGSCHKLNMVEV